MLAIQVDLLSAHCEQVELAGGLPTGHWRTGNLKLLSLLLLQRGVCMRTHPCAFLRGCGTQGGDFRRMLMTPGTDALLCSCCWQCLVSSELPLPMGAITSSHSYCLPLHPEQEVGHGSRKLALKNSHKKKINLTCEKDKEKKSSLSLVFSNSLLRTCALRLLQLFGHWSSKSPVPSLCPWLSSISFR